ncbi:MAG: HD domain-containing protein [bacterium]
MNLPDEDLCRELMSRYAMLPHIVEHSYRVCQLAVFLTRVLNRNGSRLDPDLILAGSLLHDITKTRSIETKERHAETGKQLLLELGYPEVAEVVGAHVTFETGDPAQPVNETDVVNYADKRVMHVRVVSLEDRFEDLVARYGRTPEARRRLEMLRESVLELERKVFAAGLGFAPERLQAFNRLSPYDLSALPPDFP